MNQQIKELVDMNYNGIEKYPTLVSSEIGQTSMDENITAINTAVAGGLINLAVDDEIVIRNILKLPSMDREEIQKLRDEKQDMAPSVVAIPSNDKNPNDQEKKTTEPVPPAKKLSHVEEMVIELAEDDKKKVPTKREVAFTGNITSFEKYLERKYSEVDSIISDAEKEYRDALLELYDNSESTRVD